ncbi:type II and III secretion system protein family protein [Sphingosinicella sp.]|uniref:type II and III secretion system protein family protein n=1 Tax=Sphingosinicella sp. TaxID=1917971 RepID=UPI004037DCB1
MSRINKIGRGPLGAALAGAIALGLAAATLASPAAAQPAGAVAPTNDINLSVGAGRMVRLSGTMTDLFVANDTIADVQVRSPNQIYIFGRAAGNTTVYATDRAGRVVYSANVRVGQNLGSVDQLLDMAMPEADIQATTLNNMVLLTGTVASPSDVEEAERLVQAFVGEGTQVVSRLRTATPQQVMLQVRIVEVSRSVVRDIGTNLLSRDSTGGFQFGVSRGAAGTITDRVSQTLIDPATGNPRVLGIQNTFANLAGATTLGAAGRLFGLDILSTLNLAETNGLVTTLAEPSLTALSGETASFLAGGEFPIPISQSLGTVTIEYKSFGVGLAFTPTVLENGRISIRVRPEVSELSSEGSIRFNGFDVPAITTRRAETTVELGSGQSFVIGGLLRNAHTNSIDRAPGIGSLPILGALFRSTRFRRAETELVIVVTPYLVQPVNANQIALPTDGLRTANDGERVLLGQEHSSRSGETRPVPRAGPPQVVQPGVETGGGSAAAAPAQPAPARAAGAPARRQTSANNTPQPGFELR